MGLFDGQNHILTIQGNQEDSENQLTKIVLKSIEIVSPDSYNISSANNSLVAYTDYKIYGQSCAQYNHYADLPGGVEVTYLNNQLLSFFKNYNEIQLR